MLHRNWLLISAAGLAAITSAACGGDDTTSGAGGSAGSAGSAGGAIDGAAGAAGTAIQGDASPEAAKSEAGDAAAGDADAAAPAAFVRVANLSPGIAALDVCVRKVTLPSDAGAEGGADAADSATDAADAASADGAADAAGGAAGFVGPLLKSAGIATGLAYSQVTGYISVAPGTYDVRTVAANASDCTTPLANTTDSVHVIVATASTYSTLAAIGLAMPETVPAYQVKAYADDHTVAAGQTKIRFIQSSPGTGNMDLGLNTGESFIALFNNVAYPAFGTNTGVDAGVDAGNGSLDLNGYLQLPPFTSQTLVARLTGDTPTDVVMVSGFSLPAGSIASVFAIGIMSSVTTPLALLICQDLDTSKAPLANCSVKP
jgi:hypothetical protein